MHADLFGDIFNHHGPQPLDAPLEELLLALHDDLTGAQDCVFALFQVAQELDRRAVTLLHVVAHLAFDAALAHHLAVARIQTQRRQLFIVHDDDPVVAAFHESDIRLDQAGGGFIELLPGTGVELSDCLGCRVHLVRRGAAKAR